MQAQHIIVGNDSSLWIDSVNAPRFCINHETLEKLYEFERTHPDVSQEFIDKEVNASLVEMVFRVEREYQGI